MRAVAENHKKRWTEADDLAIESRWSVFSVESIARATKRTKKAVVERAAALRLGGCGRGHKTLAAFCRETGYTQSKVLGAALRAGVVVPRAPSTTQFDPRPEPRAYAVRVHASAYDGGEARPRRARFRHFHISPDVESRVMAALRAEPDDLSRVRRDPAASWRRRGREGCLRCGRADVRHYGRDLCGRCYHVVDYIARKGAPPPADVRKSQIKACRDRRKNRTVAIATWGRGKLPPACARCGRKIRAHFCGGRCKACYETERKQNRRAAAIERGERPPVRCRTAPAVVRDVRQRSAAGASGRAIARDLGLAQSTVRRILAGAGPWGAK